MQEITFIADKVKVNGPNIDGGYKITFEVGEQEQTKVALLLAIPQQTQIQVSVKTTNG